MGCRILIQSLGELVDAGRDLESLLQDGLLTLETDVLGPFDEAREVTDWLDVLADTIVTRFLFDQWVGGSGFLLLGQRVGGDLFDGFWLKREWIRYLMMMFVCIVDISVCC